MRRQLMPPAALGAAIDNLLPLIIVQALLLGAVLALEQPLVGRGESESPILSLNGAQKVSGERHFDQSVVGGSSASTLSPRGEFQMKPRWRLSNAAGKQASRSKRPLLIIEEVVRGDANDNVVGAVKKSVIVSSATSNRSELSNGDSQKRRRRQVGAASATPATNVTRQQQQQTGLATNATSGNKPSSASTQTSLQAAKEAAFRKYKLMELKQRYLTNRAITDRAYYILLTIYASLITFGTISNSLICLTVSVVVVLMFHD